MKASPRLLALAGLATLHAAAAEPAPAAPEYRRASLLERTPFAKAERGPAKPVSGGPLELRGFFGSGDKLEVSLSRADGKESAWVRVGDKTAKWVVDAADPDAGTAEVHFDGVLLHLRLMRPEEPSLTVVAAEEKKDSSESRRDRRPGGFQNMSQAGREAMHAAMRENFERARREHPEYFDRNVQLTEEQQKARSEYMRAGMAKVREAVAKVSAEDAAQFESLRPGRSHRESSGESGNGATTAPPSGSEGAPPQRND